MTIHMRTAAGHDRRDIVRELLASQKQRHSLDQPFYVSLELFDLDMELLIERQWHFAGLESEIPDPGSYITLEIGRSSIIVCRDREERLQAFYNSCRHRGSMICD